MFDPAEVCAGCQQTGTSGIPVITTMTHHDAAAMLAVVDMHPTAAQPNPRVAGITAPHVMPPVPTPGMIKQPVVETNRSSPYSGGMGSMGRLY